MGREVRGQGRQEEEAEEEVLIARIWYGPRDWLVERTTARGRGAFGFWSLVFAVVGSFFFGRAVLWVTVLSVLALVPNFSSETPVEEE